eukprot:363538_1
MKHTQNQNQNKKNDTIIHEFKSNSTKRNIVCRWYGTAVGCKKGDKCVFIHSDSSQAVPLCRYFSVSGNCRFGDKCHFRHGGYNNIPVIKTSQSTAVTVSE